MSVSREHSPSTGNACFAACRAVPYLVFVGLIVACWTISLHFFGSPTTDFKTDYSLGVFAVLEQALAAFAMPAAFAADIFGIGFGVPSRGLFLCAELWPLFVLCIRPWSLLSRLSRRVIIGYSALLILLAAILFSQFHYSWQRFFPG